MPEITPSKYVVQAGWDSVPHLTEKDKSEIKASTQEYLHGAVTEGTPSLGVGAIYPIPLDEIIIKPFPIPRHWPRAYGLDVGWNRTAAIWGARDLDADVLYLYTEHYRARAEPSSHATAVKARGEWIPGVIDPAADGASQVDGRRLIIEYQELGLNLMPAEKSASAGIQATWDRLATGRLRVFESCKNWQAEYRIYHRNKEGLVVKANDHLLDATRFLVISGLQIATVEPIKSFHNTTTMSVALSKTGY